MPILDLLMGTLFVGLSSLTVKSCLGWTIESWQAMLDQGCKADEWAMKADEIGQFSQSTRMMYLKFSNSNRYSARDCFGDWIFNIFLLVMLPITEILVFCQLYAGTH
jgi:hypothetical protein